MGVPSSRSSRPASSIRVRASCAAGGVPHSRGAARHRLRRSLRLPRSLLSYVRKPTGVCVSTAFAASRPFKSHAQQLDTACRCYSKALQLNPADKEAGLAYGVARPEPFLSSALLHIHTAADILVARGQTVLVRQVYDAALTRDPAANWAWMRLGRVHVVRAQALVVPQTLCAQGERKFAEAVAAFQNALRTGESNPDCW